MLNKILNNLSSLNEAELRSVNAQVVARLKTLRNRETSLKRGTLAIGDKVTWNGRSGITEGTIVRIKRKKAICSAPGGYSNCGRRWDVPLTMLTKV